MILFLNGTGEKGIGWPWVFYLGIGEIMGWFLRFDG